MVSILLSLMQMKRKNEFEITNDKMIDSFFNNNSFLILNKQKYYLLQFLLFHLKFKHFFFFYYISGETNIN